MVKAYVRRYGTMRIAIVRIGNTIYEPASGKRWKTKQRWTGECVSEVPSASMENAKKAMRKCPLTP